MHLCRFDNDRLGLVEDDRIFDVSEALSCVPAPAWPYPPGDPLIIHLERIKKPRCTCAIELAPFLLARLRCAVQSHRRRR